jgi:hypothetical protein
MQPFTPYENTDPTEIARAINVLFAPESVVELRAMDVPKQATVSGYFDGQHRERLIQAAVEISGKAPGVYVTLNPVDPTLLARANNRAKSFAKNTTKDSEIEKRLWLPIDFDPVRPKGTSATDAEHEAALDRARQCRDSLRGEGWPDPFLADSGNGGHLGYRIALPNDPASTELIKRILDSLASRFSDSTVDLDRTVFNAARIWKLYGTLAAKGDHTPERPHRLARILEVPTSLEIVSTGLLEALAGTSGPTACSKDEEALRSLIGSSSAGTFDVERWLTAHQVKYVRKEPWNGGTRWILAVCPFNPEHTGNNKAIVGQLANGAIFAKCQHASCAGKKWHDMRDVIEPEWRERREEIEPLEAANDPHRLGRIFLETECSHADGPTLRYHRGQNLRWDGVAYREEPGDDLESRLNAAVKREFDRESVEAQRQGDDKRLVARQVTGAVVANVKGALRGQVLVPSSSRPPCWIDGEGPWEASDVLPAPNGLFHIPSLIDGIDRHIEPTPRYFSTFALDYPIELNAPRPDTWLAFLEQVWANDPQCVATLQEFMGYLLTQDTSQHKMLTILGPPRSGKGVISRVITGLIGCENVAGATLVLVHREMEKPGSGDKVEYA